MRAVEIAVLDGNRSIPFLPRHLAYLQHIAPDSRIVVIDQPSGLDEKAPAAEILMLWPHAVPEILEYFHRTASLRWVHLFTSGVDILVNSEAVNNTNYRITSTKGIHGYPISDHVLAFIFSFLRQFHPAAEAQREHRWRFGALSVGCREIAGLTVGIVGVGNIGLAVARKCKLLGMTVLGAKRQPFQNEWLDHCYPIDELGRLLAQADFVVLSLPLTDESKQMIGRRELQAMKKSAVLINIARGGVIDQQALINALQAGEIAGAGLDVTDPEPLPADNPLWDMPNVIITPHISAQSPQYMDRAIEVIGENLRRYIADEPLLFEVFRDTRF
jgi:D-2-hydroxyacid dehydrogenase (NADP+)